MLSWIKSAAKSIWANKSIRSAAANFVTTFIGVIAAMWGAGCSAFGPVFGKTVF